MTPDGWKRYKICGLLAVHSPGYWGSAPSGSGDIAVLRSTNLRDNEKLDLGNVAFRSFPEKKILQKRLEQGDVLLERSGGSPNKPVGRVAYFQHKGVFSYSNFMQRLRPDRARVLGKFLAYVLSYLHSSGVTLLMQQATTGIRNLNYQEYLNHELSIPPLPEQRKIAAILSSVDDAIEKTQAVIDQVQVVKRGLMQQLFTRGLPGRHTRFKQTEIGEIPEEWDVLPLGRVGSWNSGGTPSKREPKYWAGSIPWISPKDMKKARLSDAIDHVSNAAIGNGTRKTPKGSILVVIRGMILAHTFPVALTLTDVAYNQDMKALVPSTQYDPDFLLYWLENDQEKILSLVDASSHGTKRLSTSRLFAKLVPCPQREEQEKIAHVIRSHESYRSLEEAKRARMATLKSGLMSALLTGELRVKPDPEVP